MLEGGCACGRIRFRCSEEPFFAGYCHCADCRRHTGAPVSLFAGFREDQVTWSGQPAHRQSSAHVRRSFCPECGSPLTYEDDRLPGDVYLLAGAFDEPEVLRPQRHSWTSEALTCLHIADDLPRYPRFAKPRTDEE